MQLLNLFNFHTCDSRRTISSNDFVTRIPIILSGLFSVVFLSLSSCSQKTFLSSSSIPRILPVDSTSFDQSLTNLSNKIIEELKKISTTRKKLKVKLSNVKNYYGEASLIEDYIEINTLLHLINDSRKSEPRIQMSSSDRFDLEVILTVIPRIDYLEIITTVSQNPYQFAFKYRVIYDENSLSLLCMGTYKTSPASIIRIKHVVDAKSNCLEDNRYSINLLNCSDNAIKIDKVVYEVARLGESSEVEIKKYIFQPYSSRELNDDKLNGDFIHYEHEDSRFFKLVAGTEHQKITAEPKEEKILDLYFFHPRDQGFFSDKSNETLYKINRAILVFNNGKEKLLDISGCPLNVR